MFSERVGQVSNHLYLKILKAWTQCPYFVKIPNFRKFEKLESVQLREKCLKINVPVLMVFVTGQTRGMYITFVLTEKISFLKNIRFRFLKRFRI